MGKKKPKSKGSKALTPSLTDTINNSINSEVRAAALSAVNQHFLMKVCRLCETRDGPFVNIFDTDTLTAKKIEDIMPFVVQESDDLPHKICFRCSAKVEELHEFIQKAVKAQENLSKLVNKKVITKTKTRQLWEEKLNKSNISNDDICDAVIKKAMEGIGELPVNTEPIEDKPPTPATTKKEKAKKEKAKPVDEKCSSESELPLTEVKEDRPKRTRLSNIEPLLEPVDTETKTRASKRNSNAIANDQAKAEEKLTQKTEKSPPKAENPAPLKSKVEPKSITSLSFDFDDSPVKNEVVKPIVEKKGKKKKADKSLPVSVNNNDKETNESIPPSNKDTPLAPPSAKKEEKPFDILDHISMIKVNGVGVLFQCKLCNRNFLKKEVVMSHGCAKNGAPKSDIAKTYTPPEPPPKQAPNTVKYINTKTEDTKKPSALVEPPKHRPGPASRVKHISEEPKKAPEPVPQSILSTDGMPIQFPSAPSLKSLYKLVPGPNNTFQLVEDQKESEQGSTAPVTKENASNSNNKPKRPGPKSKRNKTDETVITVESDDEPSPPSSASKPYPVGLYSTVPGPHGSQYTVPVTHGPQYPTPVSHPQYALPIPQGTQYALPMQHGVPYQVGHQYLVPGPPGPQYALPTSQPTPFTTPAMKKQSYTVVQTGNPSKLLISTKPQPPLEEPPKKKQKKGKGKVVPLDQPYNVSVESNPQQPTNQQNQPNSERYFSYVNIDPLQPSYVLPTNSIIQESQITTSTPLSKPASVVDGSGNPYSCNMCGMTFGREKKLLAHIQFHYRKLDEEDNKRAGKKRGRK